MSVRKTILIIFAFIMVTKVFSQPPPPPGGGEGDPGLPFDGGISLVIAAGVGLSALGLKNRKKKN